MWLTVMTAIVQGQVWTCPTKYILYHYVTLTKLSGIKLETVNHYDVKKKKKEYCYKIYNWCY